ncbi:hypothetical protein BXT84_06040 [Sulfobacillus thermotolerans]|uniref:Secreted protein n=1 Tax=Sulfobacillus thermotolerans TaxID=338644 RepID=A0ABN5GYF2_9FIRM|nr:hypothetical protein BXT84_06040 [Sulfobacillus thermotolerans]
MPGLGLFALLRFLDGSAVQSVLWGVQMWLWFWMSSGDKSQRGRIMMHGGNPPRRAVLGRGQRCEENFEVKTVV